MSDGLSQLDLVMLLAFTLAGGFAGIVMTLGGSFVAIVLPLIFLVLALLKVWIAPDRSPAEARS